jgi:hypothetical protein
MFLAAGFGVAALGCESGGVGDPCVPEDEYQVTFSGYGVGEVNVESRSFQCETRLCLVNAFQGRVSCPYGQQEDDIAGGDLNRKCKVPGTSGTEAADLIQVPVSAQLIDRRAEDTVYCSCRCANAEGNTDDGARYCECPSGFTCAKLVEDLSLGSKQLAGSYCIRDGTQFVTGQQAGPTCVPGATDGQTGYCGNNGNNP